MVLAVVVACTTAKPAIVAGTINGVNVEELGDVMLYLDLDDAFNMIMDKVEVNPDGTFHFEKVYDTPKHGLLLFGQCGSVSIYLHNGTETTVDVTVKTDTVTGNNTLVPTYKGVNASACEVEGRLTLSGDFHDSLTKKQPFSEFKRKVDDAMNVLEEIVKSTGNKAYTKYRLREIYVQRMMCLIGYKSYTGEKTDEYEAFLDNTGMDFNDPAILRAISMYVAMKGEILSRESGVDDRLEQLRLIKNESDNQEIINSVADELITKYFMFGVTPALKEVWEEYKNTSTNTEVIAKQQPVYEDHCRLLPGSDAIDFALSDEKGNDVQFISLLGKGKYTYIDYWATWCVPCKAEIPYLAKRIKEFEGQNIEFISLSIDTDIEAWRKMVEKEGFNWAQYVIREGCLEEFDTKYHVRYIPRFMLFSPEGKIVDIDTVRPSDETFAQKMAEFGVK